MTPIASHITAFLRERLPLQRGASHIGASLRVKCLKNKLYLSTTEFPW